MPDLGADAFSSEKPHQLQVSRYFRSEGDNAQGGHCALALELPEARGDRKIRLRSEPCAIDIRTFEMDSQNARRRGRAWLPDVAAGLREHGLDLLARRGHRG